MADVTVAAVRRVRGRTAVRWLIPVLVAVGLLGLVLRFVGDGTRLFWTDEAITAMRTAGFTGADLVKGTVNGRTQTFGAVRNYAGRGKMRPLGDVVRSLAIEDAQHPPVYYLATGAWTRLFGASIPSIRAPALLFGILVPFAVAWMCFELYGTKTSAALGFALSAVSPVLVIYTQQAREYGLWAFFVAASTAMFLRAIRSHSRRLWLVYGLCSVLGLYTDPLFVTVLIAHGIFAAFRLRGIPLRWFSIASGLASLAYVPWVAAILEHMRAIELSNAWTAGPWPLTRLLEKWIFNAGTTFFDLEYAKAMLAVVLVPIFALTAYAIYWNLAIAKHTVRVLMASIFVTQVVFLYLPDIVLREHRSSVTRYGMTLWVTAIVCVAGFLAKRMRTQSRARTAWITTTFALIAIAAVSSIVDVRSSVWWDNHQDYSNLAIARTLDASPDAVVVAPGRWARVLDLSFYVNSSEHLQMLPPHAIGRPDPAYHPAFLFGGTPEFNAYSRAMGTGELQLAATANENNAQVRRFRGSTDTDLLSIWRFVR